jgi:hypothetical protein
LQEVTAAEAVVFWGAARRSKLTCGFSGRHGRNQEHPRLSNLERFLAAELN